MGQRRQPSPGVAVEAEGSRCRIARARVAADDDSAPLDGRRRCMIERLRQSRALVPSSAQRLVDVDPCRRRPVRDVAADDDDLAFGHGCGDLRARNRKRRPGLPATCHRGGHCCDRERDHHSLGTVGTSQEGQALRSFVLDPGPESNRALRGALRRVHPTGAVHRAITAPQFERLTSVAPPDFANSRFGTEEVAERERSAIDCSSRGQIACGGCDALRPPGRAISERRGTVVRIRPRPSTPRIPRRRSSS